MKRSMLQTYVHGSDKAVALYQQAFNAALVSSYPNADGTFYHAELDVYGQILAVSEAGGASAQRKADRVTGNTMQFCLHFGEGNEARLQKAADTLKDGAKILVALNPCEYSPLMTDFIDRFGVRWCLFV